MIKSYKTERHKEDQTWKVGSKFQNNRITFPFYLGDQGKLRYVQGNISGEDKKSTTFHTVTTRSGSLV